MRLQLKRGIKSVTKYLFVFKGSIGGLCYQEEFLLSKMGMFIHVQQLYLEGTVRVSSDK